MMEAIHIFVEVWDRGWHFTGACEPDPSGLDRGWFVADAAQAVADSPEHAIYAASFRKTGGHFPLVWARRNRSVPGENITARYAKLPERKDTVRVLVRVLDEAGKRVARPVTVAPAEDAKDVRKGDSRGETADTNDILDFALAPDRAYVVRCGAVEKTMRTGSAGGQQTVDLIVPAK